MHRKPHYFVGPCLALAWTLVSYPALADGLRIETLEGAWPAAIASLQNDLGSEGRAVSVVVRADERLLRCGTYSLSLDAAAKEAFEMGSCDATTDATTLRLVRRRALFDHDDTVPRPRAPRITATRVETGAIAGGARASGESAVTCTASVKPYMRDMENGGRVELRPGRYALRVRGEGVEAVTSGDGWVLNGRRGSAVTVEYDVVDTRRDEVVFRDRITMHCNVDASVSLPDPVSPPLILVNSSERTDRDRAPAEAGWNGHALMLTLHAGASVLRMEGVRFADSSGAQDASALGVRDTSGLALGIGGAYERPGIFTSLGATFAYANQATRVIYHFGVQSTVAGAIHVGDTTFYLGPNVRFGAYELTGEQTSRIEWSSKPSFGLGAAAGFRHHVRNDAGGLAYVIGGEVVAPVAGLDPWFFVASVGFGSAR